MCGGRQVAAPRKMHLQAGVLQHMKMQMSQNETTAEW